MTEAEDALRKLHTQLVDAENGYTEGIELAEKPEMVVLFREMHDLHLGHARALAAAMAEHGMSADAGGSFMATVHKAVLNVRAAVTGLEENVIPALLGGERRNLAVYDETIAALPAGSGLSELVEAQRDALANRISAIEYRTVDV